MDKLLIIGSSGLVGSKIAALASGHHFDAYNTTHSRDTSLPKNSRLDITDRNATMRLVNEIQPSVIINTAAITNVDYCESHSDEAKRLNVDGVANLVEACNSNKCRLVQVSTDYVFDGSFGHYTEEDTPKPINTYGRTKLEAEQIVAKLPSYAIARPSVIYGWNPPETSGTPGESTKPMNFAMFVVDKLKKGEQVRAVRDQYSSPTFADNLAEALLRLAAHHEKGIFHAAGKSCVSRYEFSVKIAKTFGFPAKMVQPVFSSDFKQLAQRPKYSCLKVSKAENLLGMKFMTLDSGVAEMAHQDPSKEV